MSGSRPFFRSTAALALQQIVLVALLALLLAAWLHIPDANAFEILISIVLGMLIAGVVGIGESVIALRLMRKVISARRLLLGLGIVLIAMLLWYAISLGLEQLSAKEGLWAGYLNSRFPASLRNFFSYEHFYLWLSWILSALQWIVAGLLAAGAFAWIACNAPMRSFRAILLAGRFWMALLLLAIIGVVITGILLSWTPGHGLAVEAFSLVFRVLTVVVLNAAAIAWLLQVMAHVALGVQSVGTDEPPMIQPRTVDIP
ncbi:hypothetical protein [Silvibacterium dinghuense]|uniref:Uncharacterized protein n=1 Tax=Silvibacterium dinghuense TaxID=1560006 RepID=A0A4Q1SBM1_9BACT|nr:hypothetical protein [Silvibacterium dinghuense]RXS94544.1 hypothetical protein ESZ00_15885 [Silvibacterium dinghuense]GGH15456.1 hypothetical protein GCM10011586_36550 [Silvibacterium dinghuense]